MPPIPSMVDMFTTLFVICIWLEEIVIEANLVSKMRNFFLEQHIQNPPKSVSVIRRIVFSFGSLHISSTNFFT